MHPRKVIKICSFCWLRLPKPPPRPFAPCPLSQTPKENKTGRPNPTTNHSHRAKIQDNAAKATPPRHAASIPSNAIRHRMRPRIYFMMSSRDPELISGESTTPSGTLIESTTWSGSQSGRASSICFLSRLPSSLGVVNHPITL